MAIVIRKGGMEHTEALIVLLREVWEAMPNREWFYLDSPEDVRQMMADGTMELWVALDGEHLAGAFDILHPGLDAYNYGYDLGFAEEELLRVINMDTAAVHPDYRGRGLQKKLMETAEAELQERGKHILLCTVHPENRFSLNNVLKQGYSIQKELPKYGSVRYILRKDI